MNEDLFCRELSTEQYSVPLSPKNVTTFDTDNCLGTSFGKRRLYLHYDVIINNLTGRKFMEVHINR